MFYTIYKITNQINGRFYIGSHKTKDLNDNYMGSGKYLNRAQEKYGLENFKKEILFVFKTPEEMYAKEAEIVNEEFISEENTYNVKVGGYGGWDYVNTSIDIVSRNTKASRNGAEKHSDVMKQLWKNDNTRTMYLDHVRKNIKNANRKAFLGKQHTKETRDLIGSKSSVHQLGSGNSQFGTCWISHELVGSKKCKKSDLVEYIEQGWIKGRNVFNSSVAQ